MTDIEKVDALVATGVAHDRADAYAQLFDVGEYTDDGTYEPEEEAREMERGQRVRFTANRLGLISEPHASRFEPDVLVWEGDEGTYWEPTTPKGVAWHLIKVEVDGRELFCPVHNSQFEEAS